MHPPVQPPPGARRSRRGRPATRAAQGGDAKPRSSHRPVADSLTASPGELTTRAVDLALIGRWAASTRAFAVALLERGEVRMSNQGWRDHDGRHRPSGRWRSLEPSDAPLPDAGLELRDIARQLARDAADGATTVRHRFVRDRPRQTLEVCAELIRGGAGLVMVRAIDVSAVVSLAGELAIVRDLLGMHDRLRRVGELAAGVAHDVNNVLSALRLRLELVEPRDARGGENLAAMRRVLADATLRLASLQESGRSPDPTACDVNLRRVVRDAVALFHPTARGRGVRVRAAMPNLRVSGASAPELRHVFLNLLLNARDAMPDGGVITIRARRTAAGVVVRVRDEGAGIAVGVLPHIFEPFFTTEAGRGSGLGLFTARTVMTRLGGSIAADNHPSGGAVLTLTFPPTPPAAGASTTSRVRRRPTGAAGASVLVAGDPKRR